MVGAMTSEPAFDAPDPGAARDAARAQREQVLQAGAQHCDASVQDILRAEGKARSGTRRPLPGEWSGPRSGAAAATDAAQRLNGSLNAFVRIFSGEEAACIADSLRNGDRGEGALEGVPFAFKDVFHLPGHRPGAGTRLRLPNVTGEASPVLLRLCEAGAIPIGATVPDPWCYSTTGENADLGAPVHPADASLLVGGSSSGSAVAVAAGIVPFALGTDTGGSIRIPAAFCGQWGWKPTNGLLEAAGMVPLSVSHDCPAVVAQSAAVLEAVMQVLIPSDAPAWADGRPLARVGVARALYATCDAPTKAMLTGIEGRIAASARLRDVAAPDLTVCNSIASVVTGYEAAASLAPVFARHPEAFSVNTRQRLAIGSLIDEDTYRLAQAARAQLLRRLLDEVFADVDVMVLPVTPRAYYRRSELGGNPRDIQQLTLQLLAFNRWVNTLGLPAITVPLKAGDDDGSAAVQLVARPFADLDLVRFASNPMWGACGIRHDRS